MQPQQTGGQGPDQSQLYPAYQGPPAQNGPIQPGAPMPGMPGVPGAPGQPHSVKRHKPWGLIITVVILVILLLSTIGFAVWAYGSMQDYKSHSDQKSAKAVAIAVQKAESNKDKEFTEKEKNPLKSYLGPETYGGINLQYPKTWAAAVTQNDKSALPIDAYFHPNFVPGAQSGTNFALRLQVTNQTYNEVMKDYENKVKMGKVTVTPVVLPNMPGVSGSTISGEVNQGQKDVLVVLPLRDKTIKVWTESPEFFNDFTKNILANLKFTP